MEKTIFTVGLVLYLGFIPFVYTVLVIYLYRFLARRISQNKIGAGKAWGMLFAGLMVLPCPLIYLAIVLNQLGFLGERDNDGMGVWVIGYFSLYATYLIGALLAAWSAWRFRQIRNGVQ